MSETTKKITTRQAIAISELLQGAKTEAAAAAAGVTPRTIGRWLRDDTFTAELRRAELRVMDAVGWRLIGLVDAAVDALSDVLANPSVRGASVKRLTAQTIISLLLTWRQQVDFETRLTELEGRINAKE